MDKTQTLEAAAQGRGCLGRAREDEPVFVLRANDPLAPDIVRVWALAYSNTKMRQVNKLSDAEIDRVRSKRDEAYRVADQMIAWRARQGKKDEG